VYCVPLFAAQLNSTVFYPYCNPFILEDFLAYTDTNYQCLWLSNFSSVEMGMGMGMVYLKAAATSNATAVSAKKIPRSAMSPSALRLP
jgi:hypothetical protein